MAKNLILAEAIEAIKESLRIANNAYFHGDEMMDPPEVDATINYHIERAFVQALVLVETLNLSRVYDQIDALYAQAKEEGFAKTRMGPYYRYLVWPELLDNYLHAIATSHNADLSLGTVIKDLESILRQSLYSITDTKIFPGPPEGESEVHARIEAVLKCIFPDLKHKPTLTKPIKNFEPDTGLPSIRTLIEYKFISDEKVAKQIVDEILADTRGYTSKDWNTFVYVIYETHRVISETQWNCLVTECEVRNTRIIVLQGQLPQGKKGSSKKKKS